MRESQIQSRILNYLKPKGFTVKLSDKWYSGMPDIMFIRRSKVYFFEVKTPAGRLTRLQDHVISELNKAGAYAYVVTSLEEVKGIVQ